MKHLQKKLLCIILAAITVLTFLASCTGKELGTDDEDTKAESERTPLAPTGITRVGFSVDDVEALFKLFGVDGADIKDLDISYTYGNDGMSVIGAFADLFGEQHSTELFCGDKYVISSNVLDRVYGANDISRVLLENSYFSRIGAEKIEMTRVVGFFEKYRDMLISEIKTNGGLVLQTNDGISEYIGTVTNRRASIILSNVFEKMTEDDDFYGIFNIHMADFLFQKPSKERIASSIESYLNENKANLHINSLKLDKDGNIHEIDIDFFIDGNNKIKADISDKGVLADFEFSVCDELDDVSYDEQGNETVESRYMLNALAGKLDISDNGASVALTLSQKNSYAEYVGNDDRPVYMSETDNRYSLELAVADGELSFKIKNSYSPYYEDRSAPENMKLYNVTQSYSFDIKNDSQSGTGSVRLGEQNTQIDYMYPDRSFSTETEYIGEYRITDGELIFKLNVEVNGQRPEQEIRIEIKQTDSQVLCYMYLGERELYSAEIKELPEFTPVDDMTRDDMQKIAEGLAEKNEVLYKKLGELIESIVKSPEA